MRILAAALAVAAAVALAGCSGAEPHSPVDPQEAERGDYVVPLTVFVVLALLGTGIVVLVVLRSRRARNDDPPTERRRDR